MAGTKYMGFLIKPASSACNMRCRYCFYYDVADHRACSTTSVMDDTVARAIIDKGLGVAPDAHVSFMFQGGEPTLAGLEFFERFVAYVDEHRYRQVISYALQTNGMLVDDRWAAFFKEHDFLVGISVDGYRELHDYIRLDASGKGTYARALRAFHLLQDAGVQVNALTVLTEQLARHPQQAFNALIREHIDHVQYIPCLPGLDEEADEFSLTPRLRLVLYIAAGYVAARARSWPIREHLVVREHHADGSRPVSESVRHARQVLSSVCGRGRRVGVPVRFLRAR